jgi:hypothetical protein
MRVLFETSALNFTGLVVAGHLDDDSITILLDPEYADEGRSDQRVTVNPDYCTVLERDIARVDIEGQHSVIWTFEGEEHIVTYGEQRKPFFHNRLAAAEFWSCAEHAATAAEISGYGEAGA